MASDQKTLFALNVDNAKTFTQAKIDEQLKNKTNISVLEAGGGSLSRIQLPDNCEITVIDISPEQLASNSYATHKILGDLHTYQLEPHAFDLIICWDVLEHLEDPSKVFKNLLAAVKADGLIIVAAPNPHSLSGMVTKFTPHWFHVFVLRHVFKSKMAGLPGHAPFPTFMRRGMYPQELQRKSRTMNIATSTLVLYESSRRAALRQNNRLLGLMFDGLISAARLLSFGKWRLENSDYIFLARTPR